MECTVDYQNKQVSFSSVLVRIKFEHCLSETCRSRFEKISNNLLLKVSYRFFYIISQSSFLCYYQVVQFQKVIAAQKTQRPGLSIDGPWVPVNETVIAVSVKKHGWLCERVVQGVLLDPVKWQVSTEQPRHLQLATVGQQRNVGQQSRVVTSNIFFSRHEAYDDGGGASKM